MQSIQELPENELIRLSAARDAQAFETLMSPYEQRVFATCLRLMNQEQDAADMLQESMLRIWRTIASFSGQSSFATWMYRVVTNVCLDALRRRKKDREVSLSALSDTGDFDVPDRAPGPEDQAVQSARQEAIAQSLQALSPELRAAFVLRDLQGQSYEDVARELRISMGTAKSRIYRARLQLAKRLQSYGELFSLPCVQRGEGREGNEL